MSIFRPLVYVITDGSGSHGISRLNSTAGLIKMEQGTCGDVFGIATDREIYRAILDGNCRWFVDLAEALAHSFVKHEIDMVAGDAMEGFNPTHDLCRALINAAVAQAQAMSGRRIANYEICLTEWEQNREGAHDDRCTHLSLSHELFERKLNAAQTYVELQGEVLQALAARSPAYFQVECLRKAQPGESYDPDEKPDYERWGERRAAEGTYQSVIRFRNHVLPILQALDRLACVPVENSLQFCRQST
jgi:hypothetical protein